MPFSVVRTTPPSFHEVGAWPLESIDDVATVRAGLRTLLAADPDFTDGDSVVLVASELATNAVRHGSPPAGLRLLRGPEGYVVDAVDAATDVVPHISRGRAPGLGGFGIALAVKIATDVGSYADDAVKHVWARFGGVPALDAPGAGAAARLDA
ncbi:ATP-binding protein [Luteimicrobium subarcticum]|uniref:Histidine kinase/HSP90-like ATPase domain-containing protein n=1 Tax=Luteimicrobium subarcticum TaxID=620910 RepID=A0A2M8WUC0_9MICO|nr:ATP-binding protein [Luteimicrobium subarcticum]PJI94456.1 hypothetical protein CLV34_0292 [Luteimicrobium subarcticum]